RPTRCAWPSRSGRTGISAHYRPTAAGSWPRRAKKAPRYSPPNAGGLSASWRISSYQGHYADSIDASRRCVQVLRDLGEPTQLRHGLLTLLGCLIEARRFDEADPCLAEIATTPGPIELSTMGDLNVRQGLLCL